MTTSSKLHSPWFMVKECKLLNPSLTPLFRQQPSTTISHTPATPNLTPARTQEMMTLQFPAIFHYSRWGLENSNTLKLCSLSQNKFRGSCHFRRYAKSGNGDDVMDEEERREWRKKIWEVIDKYPDPDVEEELDPEEKKSKMQKLLAEYPLVVDEDDPDWPEDADGRGFSLDQFFNKITIKNVEKDADDDNYDSDKEIVWQDDDYIRPIKDITSSQWEETVFKDISPLLILVHNRYKRPKENEKCRDELEKAVNIIWNCRLPSPRCVAIDAIVDRELVSALNVSNFPELIFAKSGKIIYREKVVRTADELSKIMAFFYFGAAKPPFFDFMENLDEAIPSAPINADSL